jgi:hypothetical protein
VLDDVAVSKLEDAALTINAHLLLQSRSLLLCDLSEMVKGFPQTLTGSTEAEDHGEQSAKSTERTNTTGSSS